MSTAKSSSSRSSTSPSMARSSLVALPSVSYSLSTLPQATSLDGVALHPNAMSTRHAAESEAKLRKAISKSSSSHAPPAYLPPPPTTQYSPDSAALTMRKPLKKLQA